MWTLLFKDGRELEFFMDDKNSNVEEIKRKFTHPQRENYYLVDGSDSVLAESYSEFELNGAYFTEIPKSDIDRIYKK